MSTLTDHFLGRFSPLPHDLLGREIPGPAVRAGTVLDYHTFDLVNLATLDQLVTPLRLTIEHQEPRDRLACAQVVRIDADFWWTSQEQRRRGLLALVRQENRPGVVAVHGWQLDDGQIDWLRQNNIHASNRLDHHLAVLLANAVAVQQADKPVSPRKP